MDAKKSILRAILRRWSCYTNNFAGERRRMQLQTILNRVEKHGSFVYEHIGWADEQRSALQITVRSRVGSRARCSGCGIRRRTYDRLAPRRFEFVPLWGLLVFFVYAMRRVDCKRCGVRVEWVPWSDGKSPMTRSYAWFLARWAKRMSWKEVAEIFHTSWDSVYRAVREPCAWPSIGAWITGICRAWSRSAWTKSCGSGVIAT
jgi:hypothetical protein